MSLTNANEYFTPSSNEQVLELLDRFGDSALIVAGGSFVHGLEARGLLLGIEALIDLRNLQLKEISSETDGLTIGAMVSFAQLQQLEEVQTSAALGAVWDALQYPPLQIKNVATVGGNIAAACPYFDLPTAFLTLDAEVRVQAPSGPRSLSLPDMLVGLFQNALEANEYVAALFLPRQPDRTASAFIKLETNANDLAIVNVAVRISLDSAGVCQEARVVIGGGVAETPVRALATENLLQGATLSADVLQQAAAAVHTDVQPMSDHRASAAYRSAMAQTLTQRALRRALDRL